MLSIVFPDARVLALWFNQLKPVRSHVSAIWGVSSFKQGSLSFAWTEFGNQHMVLGIHTL